jgi:hypothetical protein
MFSLARLAKVNRTNLLVASDAQLKPHLAQLGIVCTQDFDKPDMARLYVESTLNIPEKVYEQIPEDLEYETVALLTDPPPPQSGPHIEHAPYANMPMKRNYYNIPPTMPLDKVPPRGTPEPFYSVMF